MKKLPLDTPMEVNMRHYRFVRTPQDTPVIEMYEPKQQVKWAVCTVVIVLSLIVLLV